MRIVIPLIAFLAYLFGGVALAADPAGEATKILETARVQGEAGARFLKVRGAVFTGDVITTNQRGQAQLRFVDDTRMVIGPNSQVTIDKFVFQGGARVSGRRYGQPVQLRRHTRRPDVRLRRSSDVRQHRRR